MGLKALKVEPKVDHHRQAETCSRRVLECIGLLVLCFREGKYGSLHFWVGVLAGGLQLDSSLSLFIQAQVLYLNHPCIRNRSRADFPLVVVTRFKISIVMLTPGNTIGNLTLDF